MKKRILTILLLVSPYLYALIVVLFFRYSDNFSAEMLQNLLLIFCGFIVAIFISNMIYAFILAKHGESSAVLLFWDMLLKLCNIPFYFVVFSFGFLMSLVPKGIVITFPLAIIDYLLLLPSSMYGVSGLLQARRERKITTLTAVVNIILHFFFCVDVISAIVMFCIVRVKGKNDTGKL